MLGMMLRDLRLSPLRTTLTALSMLMGVVAVICASLIGSIGASALEATNAQVSGRASTYATSVAIDGGLTLDAERMERLAERTGAIGDGAMAPVVSVGTTIAVTSPQASGTPIDVVGADMVFTTCSYRGIYLLPLVDGTWLSGESDEAGVQIVVNEAARQKVGGTGSEVHLASKRTRTVATATIAGIVNDGVATPRYYVNAVSFALLEPQLWDPIGLVVYWHPETGTVAEHEVSSLVGDLAYDVLVGKVSGVQRVDAGETYAAVVRSLQLAFAACGGLLLFVAALGMVNIGLADVEQRSHELLIRRALGSSRGGMMVLVYGSSLMLSGIVSALSVAMSAVAVGCIPYLLPSDSPIPAPAYPYDAVWQAVVAAVATALLGSVAPAVKAARLEPSMVLR